MKIIKTVGLALFISGFAIFNGLFFSARYVLTKAVVETTTMDPTRAALFMDASSTSLGNETGSVFSFVSGLKRNFESANQTQLNTYGITQE